MRTLLLLLLLLPSLAFAQGSRRDDIAFKNLVTGIAPAAGATVTVCTSAGTGIPCTPLATIYSDVGLTQTATNPIIADSNGNYGFYAAPGRYVTTITGTGLIGKSITYTLACDPTGACTFKSGIPWVDVLAYGALGDDATDDTANIQSAIDAASAAGACVHFNGKTYKTTAALTLATAPCLIGDGSERSIIHNATTTCFAKKGTTATVFDAHIERISCRDNNTGTSTTTGFDFTEFNRSYLVDLDVWYKKVGYQWKHDGVGGGNYYNRGFNLKTNDVKFPWDFDTTNSVNENQFYATDIARRAGTWDAGGGEIGISISGVGNKFFGVHASVSGATSTGLQFKPSPAANSHNDFHDIYFESSPTTDIDATNVANPNLVDGLISDGRTSPIVLDNNLQLNLRTDAASITLNGVAGQPNIMWARSTNANGSGTGVRNAYSTFYPPSATADPTAPTPLAGAMAYRSDLTRMRWFDTTWHSVIGLDTIDTLTNKSSINGVCYVTGTYTTIMGAYNDTTNCKVVAVPTLGGACYTETVSSTWTLNRAGVPIVFLGCATVTFGTNIISVPQGTGTVSILAPMGPQNADGVKFVYTGTASFLTVGSSAGSTLNPTFKNIRFDLTGAGNASIALDTKFAGNCDYDVDVRGNGAAGTTQIGLKFDGTGTGGSSCTGKTIRATVAAVNIGLYGTGTGANAFNNNDVAISTTGLNGTTPQLVSIDQGSADNRIYISNCQTLTTCIHASGTAQFNTFYSANQSITNDVVFDASTTNNVAYLNAGITAFSDAGVHNRIIPNGSNPGVMSFSCTGVLTASSTLLLTGGACTTTSATGGPQWPIDNGNWIYRNLRCTSGAGGVNASSGVVTVRNVGNPTSLTATFGTGTAANDLNSAHALIGPGPGSVLDVTITSQIAETLKNIACTLERE